MNTPVPYIIGSVQSEPSASKVKKYRRRRVYVLNIKRILLFSVALLLLFSAVAGVIIYKSRIRYLIAGKSYYYLQLAFSENGTVAANKAADFVSKGGAGYIINDGGFRITVSVYSSKSDAEAVLSRYAESYSDAEIYEMKIPSLNLKKYMSTELSGRVRPIYLFCERELFDRLEKLDYALGRGELSEAAALKSINDTKAEIKEKRLSLLNIKGEFPTSEGLDLMLDFTDNVAAILDNLFPLNEFSINHKIKLALCTLCALYGETVGFFQKM